MCAKEGADISSNYSCNAPLICTINHPDFSEISREQSTTIEDYRLHYFGTILYIEVRPTDTEVLEINTVY